MAEVRKINTLIELTYQATKATSGLTDVTMEIYDETRTKDIITFPDVVMIEIGSTGRYYGSFTPDEEGSWRAMVDSATKSGKSVRDYKIVGHDIDSVGDAVAVVDTNMAKDTTVAKDATVAKDTTVAKAGADGDTLKTLSDQIDGIASFESGPQLG